MIAATNSLPALHALRHRRVRSRRSARAPSLVRPLRAESARRIWACSVLMRACGGFHVFARLVVRAAWAFLRLLRQAGVRGYWPPVSTRRALDPAGPPGQGRRRFPAKAEPCPLPNRPPSSAPRLPRGFVDRNALDIAGADAMMAKIRARLSALRLRGGRDAVRRIHRGARQIPARSRPAERRRVLVPGRRRAMAVAALRPDRAARPLCRRELRKAAKALSQLSRRLGVPQREAGPGPVPPVHAVRRRHGRRGARRRPTPRSA